MKKLALAILSVCLCTVMVFASGCEISRDTGDQSSSEERVSVVKSSQKEESVESTVENSKEETSVENSKEESSKNEDSSSKSSSKSTSSNSSSKSSSKSTSSKSSSKSSSSSTSSSKESVSLSYDKISVSVPEELPDGGDLPTAKDGDIYVSPTGNDSNAGTQGSPLKSLAAAVSKATPGTTIFMMQGTYDVSERINLTSSGTEAKPITIQAYNWEKVVLDFTNQPYGHNNSAYVGIYLKGNYWKIQGLEICHAGDNGIKVEGSYNYIGRCVLHHNGDSGIQLGFGHDFSASGLGSSNTGEYCAYNLIENCDSYLNYDFDTWGDADGFACKMHNGKGNVFKGCRAWSNCDDAWDLYETDYAVGLIDCWCWDSAKINDFKYDEYFSDAQYLAKKSAVKAVKVPSGIGNGNGMKFGGNGAGGSSKGTHFAINCVSFNNDKSSSNKGFDENSHGDGVVMENCVGWDNGYNYMFENGGSKTAFTNCISFYTETRGTSYNKANRLAGECGSGGKITNCNFTFDGGDLAHTKPYVTASDFISLSVEDAKAPRQADGSLPNNGFARLKSTSPFYGMGLK